ncbi:MAG TPA: NADH-quinone oxidoreductase subunit C [Solibacterales bacterium]|nr:NADH-quinone oxidoreductase subunit C [Bryobacterales bacterium]
MLSEQLRDSAVAAAVEEWNPSAIVDGKREHGETTLYISPDLLQSACRFLKESEQFVRLSTVTAVDWYPAEPRFEVVYHLHSLDRNERLRLKVRVSGEKPEVDSVTGVWRGANWYEREVFDLFGITFPGHPDLTRILMPDYWEGHPLRKDFPVHGHKYSYQNE